MCLPDCSRCNICNSNPHLLSMKHCLFQTANLLPALYVSHGFSLEYPVLPKNPVTGFACKQFPRWVEPTYSCLNKANQRLASKLSLVSSPGRACGIPRTQSVLSQKSGKGIISPLVIIPRCFTLWFSSSSLHLSTSRLFIFSIFALTFPVLTPLFQYCFALPYQISI